MSRRKKSVKRPILPDARYDSQTVSKFINAIMYQGKKSTAERIFYDAMDLVESRTSQSGVTIFKQALTNLKPAVEVKSRRVGGANYQIPFPVSVREWPGPPGLVPLVGHLARRTESARAGQSRARTPTQAMDCGQAV